MCISLYHLVSHLMIRSLCARPGIRKAVARLPWLGGEKSNADTFGATPRHGMGRDGLSVACHGQILAETTLFWKASHFHRDSKKRQKNIIKPPQSVLSTSVPFSKRAVRSGTAMLRWIPPWMCTKTITLQPTESHGSKAKPAATRWDQCVQSRNQWLHCWDFVQFVMGWEW